MLESCSAFADHLLYDVDSPTETCGLEADAFVAPQKLLETKRALKVWAPNRNSILRNRNGLLQNRGLSSCGYAHRRGSRGRRIEYFEIREFGSAHTKLSMSTWNDRLPNWIGFPTRVSHAILLGVAIGTSLAISSRSLLDYFYSRRRLLLSSESEDHNEFSPRPIELRSDEIVDGVTGLIGNTFLILYCLMPSTLNIISRIGHTPLIRINSLSNALGVEILVRRPMLRCSFFS
jgi:hypothetical protein